MSSLTHLADEVIAGAMRLPRGDGVFIDLFSGCGGTSLGLMKAGWRGLFGVEKESMAFETLAHNLVKERTCGVGFEWPGWLPAKPISLESLMKEYKKELRNLRGQVDLVSGSPPCQGVSMAGRRKRSDSRNRLWQEYAKFIDIVRPRLIFMESVKGFCHAYRGKDGRRLDPFSERLMDRLGENYHLSHDVLSCQLFGVPQRRERFFMIGVRRDDFSSNATFENWMCQAERLAGTFRRDVGLPVPRDISAGEALADLETKSSEADLIPCLDAPGRWQINYKPPKHPNNYLRRLRGKCDTPNSMRLAKHGESVVQKFKKILKGASPGKLDHKKRNRMLLDRDNPACTVMTLPDDIIHYSEPRILTVRECARLQSFPDAFIFHGKYTTGGHRRRWECPRYTQVGNAVPPLAAEFWGRYLALVFDAIAKRQEQRRAA